MSEYKIAIDIGGTIEDTWEYKRNWFIQNGYDIGHNPIGRNDIVKIISRDTDFYLKMVQDVYNDESIMNHKIVAGVYEALQILSNRTCIVILSSRDDTKEELTKKWIEKNNLNTFIDEIYFLGDTGDKIEWCRKNGIKILIDDDIRHLAPHTDNLCFERIHFNISKKMNINNPNSSFYSFSTWKEIADHIQNKLK